MDIHWSHVYPDGRIMQVAKWGNSLAVRLPAAVVEALTEDMNHGQRFDNLVVRNPFR